MIIIREMRPEEYGLLDDFLYEAIFVRPGEKAPEREVIRRPELQVYVKDFGSFVCDHALAAEDDGRVIGAVWVRITDDYGHVDDETPSLAVSLYKEYRGHGTGTALMRGMLALLCDKGIGRVSLSVQKDNYAYKMYRKLGFEIIRENEEDYIMVCETL